MKKKIIYISIITLIIVLISILVIINMNKEELLQGENIAQRTIEKLEDIKDMTEIAQGEMIINIDNMEDSTLRQDETENNEVVETKTQKNNNVNVSSKTNTSNKNSNNPTTQNKSIEKVELKQEEKEPKAVVTNQGEKTQTTVTKTEETKQEIEKKYVINTTMINKLKKTIEDNATDDMKKYGYEIKTDSSIVNSTTGFTYSLFNINNSLVNRNGTIKIYAQDYIVNGKVVETRCYIL